MSFPKKKKKKKETIVLMKKIPSRVSKYVAFIKCVIGHTNINTVKRELLFY